MDDVTTTITGLSDNEALDRIGLLIEKSAGERSVVGTNRAFALIDELEQRNLAPNLAVLPFTARNAGEIRTTTARSLSRCHWTFGEMNGNSNGTPFS
jgi:hypothetical protein